MSNRRQVIALLLCVFATAFAMFVRHSEFPFFYHPDEKGKADQIIKHKRNFNHPMMMLSTVDVARYGFLRSTAQKDMQKVTEVGRRTTAAISALAAASLALLAFRAFGAFAGWAVGVLCATNPLLYELAHYFKEDPWLSAGVAFVCLALNGYSATPGRRQLYLLAAACAAAAAGKYIGFALMPVGFWLVWKKTQPLARKAEIQRFLGVFLGVWLLFNLRFIYSPWAMFASLQDETTKLAGLSDGVSRSIPHGFYIMTQSLYGGWTLPIACLGWLAFAVRAPRKITIAEWVLAIVAVSQFVLFSFVPKSAFRYHLPVSLAFTVLAVCGFARWIELAVSVTSRRVAIAFAAIVFGFAVYFQVQALCEVDRSFRADDRRELIAWIRTNLPPDAVIASDEQVNIPNLRRQEHKGLQPLTQRVFGADSKDADKLKKEVADFGTLAALRAQGVTHLALCERTYGRYLDDTRTTKSGTNKTPERDFYETALTKGRVVWASELGRVTYLQPGLKLVDIRGIAE